MKHVLDVGNCDHDHGKISDLLAANFAVEVTRCHTAEQALQALRNRAYDLVLVNRLLDVDQSEGLDIIRTIKGDPQLAATPCMLISNYPEHQATAVAAGALAGFGKRELAAPSTKLRLAALLS